MNLIKRIKQCKRCIGICYEPKPLVFGDIIKSKIIFISEEPTIEARDSNFYEYYLGNRNQRFHKEWMPKLHINENWLKENVYITHVYKCYSGFKTNEKNKRDKICARCLEWFNEEKEIFTDKIIITFGGYAFSKIMSITRHGYTRYIIKSPNYKLGDNIVYPLPHPSSNNAFIFKNKRLIDDRLETIGKIINTLKKVDNI